MAERRLTKASARALSLLERGPAVRWYDTTWLITGTGDTVELASLECLRRKGLAERIGERPGAAVAQYRLRVQEVVQ